MLSREAWRFQFSYYSYVENDQPIIVVDHEYTAGETAQAIISETDDGWFADSIGVHRRRYQLGRYQNPEEFRQWLEGAAGEGAAFASVLAELYVGSIATLTPTGELVVTLGDIYENGPRWDHLVSVLPGLGLLPVAGIVLKLGKHDIKLTKQLVKGFKRLLGKQRKALLAKASAAKTKDEALDIIERGIAAGPAHEHHIATPRNRKSTLRGGPWTPRFEPLFKKAGMTLEDAENKLYPAGHFGPHPEEYHKKVYNRLVEAVGRLEGPAYRDALVAELRKLRNEASTPGTELNVLIAK